MDVLQEQPFATELSRKVFAHRHDGGKPLISQADRTSYPCYSGQQYFETFAGGKR
jgi:hypothetical protein